ncbi:hypothetical protein [Thermacetogenium phaeum]|nr:hypothetical protein [Thermacetogenium phaeum]
MEELASEIISSFRNRRKNLHELQEEVKNLLRLFETERLEMRAGLQKELHDFINDLEVRVNKLLAEFEEERYRAEQIWMEMENKMEHLRRVK